MEGRSPHTVDEEKKIETFATQSVVWIRTNHV